MSTRGRPTLYKAENAELARKFCMLAPPTKIWARYASIRRRRDDALGSHEIPDFPRPIRAARSRRSGQSRQMLPIMVAPSMQNFRASSAFSAL